MRADSLSKMAYRIDAHHHLWRYTAEEFGWIPESDAALRRDFGVEELSRELRTAQVDGSVAVQARQTMEETEWLLSLAEANTAIWGVVGWVPLASPDLGRELETVSANKLLRGVRHVVQSEPTGFLDDLAFNAGIRELRSTGLVYDILIYERQLLEVLRFVDRHPGQRFVLDHVAKPRIAIGELEPWRTKIRELARRPNVSCKISGMVTEADPRRWTPEQLQPYAETVLDAFGPDRLMVGTDWPVLTVGCTYAQWWELVASWIAPLSVSERAQIVGETAIRVYGLQVRSAPKRESTAVVDHEDHA